MCLELQRKGISSNAVLEAMESVPRHWFIDSAFESLAYEDRAIHIGNNQTISHPSTVAIQSQLLELEPGMKVLEIGTGSGYQTAVLCRMGARVDTIERQKNLFDHTRPLLRELGFTARCYLGDGYQGLVEVNRGPYDRILITCGASHVPEALMSQLRIGGLMVVPYGEGSQSMLRLRKMGETSDQWDTEQFGTFTFVPMLGGRAM